MDNQNGVPAINCWIYLLGEVNGADIKVGRSTGTTMRDRLKSVDRDQMTSDRYVLLAALRGDPKDEASIKSYFAEYRRPKGTRKEYFYPEPAVVEYANWLRQWWWVSIDPDEKRADIDAVSPDLWLPTPDRRLPAPIADPGLLIQPYQDLTGPLRGTAWDWFVSPKQSIQDYFTPPELIDAARCAMGTIDLDAASHPIANRAHRIPDYFHINRSAFDNDWNGRVWLNPPYGNNAPWFERILHFLDTGQMTQLCMLSPLWVFNTELARPIMLRSSAMVVLAPTPKFWGNAENKTGTNQPHAVVYWGDRVDEFLTAFEPFGIPMAMAWRISADLEVVA